MDELKAKHPRFRGNWEDLRQFMLLADSAIRSQQREDALQAWQQYKLGRQREKTGKRGSKGSHMRALIARAIDLTGADLQGICIGYADFRGVTFDDCDLRSAWMKGSNFEYASLRGADFTVHPDNHRGVGRLLHANLSGADLTGANLAGVDLSYATMNDADLSGADFTDAWLTHATLVRAVIEGTIFSGTSIYGIAAWDLGGTPAVQRDLVIRSPRPDSDVSVTVDQLDLAQFVYLLLNNERIRDVIDTMGRKGVLVLGRFTPERKAVLDAIRGKLRDLGFVPMLFDFQRPTQRDFTETIKTLAGLSRFIIADITNPRSSPLELQAIVPDYSIPLVPIIAYGEEPFAMFSDLRKYQWMLPIRKYDTLDNLMKAFPAAIVEPAIRRSEQLRTAADEPVDTVDVKTFL